MRFFISFLAHAPRLRAMLIAARQPLITPAKQVVAQLAACHPPLERVSFGSKYVWMKVGDEWIRMPTRSWTAAEFERWVVS